jgi:hypothetical protein
MFRGFFDECNRSVSDVQFVMAGWTAKVEEWESFCEAWHKCLSEKPSIRYFKTSEANRLSDEFYKMSIDASEAKRLALTTVLCNHDVRGYIATAEHTILTDRPEKLRKMMGTRIYDWAFIAMVSTVLNDFLERGERTEKIDFIFDGCTELRTCIDSYEIRREEFPPSMRNICGEAIPGDDKELAGLQAADLLAGEYSTYLRSGHKTAPHLALETAMKPICAFPARPPQQIGGLLAYAQEVYQREELVTEMLKSLKAMGVNLNDFKEDKGKE